MINPKIKTKIKTKTRQIRTKTHHQTSKATRAQKIGLYLIIATAVVVVFAVLINIFFNSSQLVKNRLQVLAKTYYEDYYYGNLTSNGDTSTLAQYNESGLPSVKLNQLLAFNNHQYDSYRIYFVNDRYTCSLTNTLVKYYPVAPYGPTDYTVDYRYDCSHMQTKNK